MEKPIYLFKRGIFTADIYYKVYPTETGYYFIKLGGQLYDDNALEDQLQLFGMIITFIRRRMFSKRRSESEQKIDREMQTNPDALLAKRKNFKIGLHDIANVQVSDTPTFHTFGNDKGSMKITIGSGKVLSFIIPMSMRVDFVMNAFESQTACRDIS